MLGDKKKSAHRLSSLFLGGSAASDSSENKPSKTSPVPSESGGRLTKVKKRLSSATHLTPEYPPPASRNSSREISLSNPTIQPVGGPAAAFEPLEPPPPLDEPSRSVSPHGSRPATPNGDGTSDSNLKKLRRKSRLFGGSQSGDGVATGMSRESPLAWIVGHKGKVPYNLTMLLNGEKVSCFPLIRR